MKALKNAVQIAWTLLILVAVIYLGSAGQMAAVGILGERLELGYQLVQMVIGMVVWALGMATLSLWQPGKIETEGHDSFDND